MSEGAHNASRGGDGAPPSTASSHGGANETAPRARSWVAACLAVAATYGYFLIFAQFALLALAARGGVTTVQMQWLLAAMGVGGIAGAIGAVRVFRVEASRRLLALSFAGCTAAAVAAALIRDASSWSVIFALVGLSLGALTVTLAAMLRRAVGGRRLGLCIGIGTGLAYAGCNVPAVFAADARVQTLLAALAAAGGGLLASQFATGEAGAPVSYARGTVARWVVALAALVWMDSAVFGIIQQTETLRTETWEGAATLWTNAAVHLGAGVLAGWLLDRGWRRAPAVAAIGLLGAASLMLGGALPKFMAPQWLYVAGVSLYSVVLVYFPAASGRAGIAALVYAVAGWIGSALGLGMAQNLQHVPAWFAGVALVVVLGALGWRGRGAALLLAFGFLALGPRADAADNIVARGREVYIREGCIHCHSQYVRPHVARDVERWGPATTLEQVFAGAPPLPGNRRQGPDLANVGNRRSGEWNRLQLQTPRAVAPGSRMPAYAHLFAGGDESDGEALVAYLATLGAETISERLMQVRAWRPARTVALTETRARKLFAQLCAPCHGNDGRGDGSLAARLSVRPPDWTAGGWRQVAGAADVELELSRLIKFGLPGSPMAGHEYLRDDEIVGLARVVRAWHKP